MKNQYIISVIVIISSIIAGACFASSNILNSNGADTEIASQMLESIEELFNSKNATVIGADVNEISTSPDTNLTEFSAALIAKKIVCCHINTKLNT